MNKQEKLDIILGLFYLIILAIIIVYPNHLLEIIFGIGLGYLIIRMWEIK